jgi:hypothetical protein
LVPSFDGGDDAVWVGGPDERFRIIVVLGDVTVDGIRSQSLCEKFMGLRAALASTIERLQSG